MTKLVTKIKTFFTGKEVGQDEFGNKYYISKSPVKPGSLKTQKRWVIYKGEVEASAVPPLWHAWLHHSTDDIPEKIKILPWQKPHLANLSGTPYAYRPKGHTLKGGKRQKATGDYEAWTPQ